MIGIEPGAGMREVGYWSSVIPLTLIASDATETSFAPNKASCLLSQGH
jgi:hypothetical protein